MLKKLQNLPDTHKKIIIIAVVILLGALMGFFWITFSARDLSKIEEAANSIGLPTIDLPNFDIPVENNPELQDTAEWQIYTDTEYGFEIQHPRDWQVEPLNIKNPLTNSNLFISVIEAGTPMDIDETQAIYINGVKGYKIFINSSSSFKIVELTKGSQKYELEARIESPEDVDIFNQMISTFAFINPKS